MQTLRARWASLEHVERTYWLGLVLLFLGVSLGVSVATALTVCGAVLVGESILTSYLAGWMGMRQ
jgi:hypothetical protein